MALAITFLIAPSAWAQESSSTFDKVWQFANWYSDNSNPVVQKVLFTGRFQEDFASIGADQGDMDEWNVRRLRLGNKVTLFRHYLVHAEVELNPQERDPFYMRMTDAYVSCRRTPHLRSPSVSRACRSRKKARPRQKN